ncbi:uncharacterized protein LOC129588593 isoform X2 [Paramacrobiotus metropolitanus]|nr:uncharacterized protein LOC129588593 isoform X2 [Paramacrobiotus metropolitanus]
MEHIVQRWLQDLRWSCACEHVTLQSKSLANPEVKTTRPAGTSKVKNRALTKRPRTTSSTGIVSACNQTDRKNPNDFLRTEVGQVHDKTTPRTYEKSLLETLDGPIYEMQAYLSQLFEITDINQKNDAAIRTICIQKLPPLISNLEISYKHFRGDADGTTRHDDNDLMEFISRASKEITALASHISHATPYDPNVVALCADSISEIIREMAAEIVFSECLKLKKDLLSVSVDHCHDILMQLLRLTQRGPGVCVLVIQAGIMPILIQLCKETTNADILAVTLRTLGCIAALPDGILEIQGIAQFEDLISLLWRSSYESVCCEAAGFLAQVAVHLQISDKAPAYFQEQQKLLLGTLCDASPKIVRAVNTLCEETSDEEVFLVGTACASALTLIRTHIPIIELLIQNETMDMMLRKWKRNVTLSTIVINQILSIVIAISTQQSGQLHLDTIDDMPEFLLLVLDRRKIYNEHEKMTVVRAVKKGLSVIARLSHYQLFAEKFLSLQGQQAVGSVMSDSDCDETTTNTCWKILQNLRINSNIKE